jgi:hypothetical protein
MLKDIGKFTIHFNSYHLSNFSLGFDFYYLIDGTDEPRKIASIFQLSLLFFNVTLTKWTRQLR